MPAYNIGKVISTRRNELGITQEQLADYVGVSVRTVSRWETGKSLPDMYYLLPLSKVLDMSVQNLIEDQDADNANKSSEESLIQYSMKNRGEKMKKMLLGIFLLVLAVIVILFPLYNPSLSYGLDIQILIIFFILVLAIGIFIVGYNEK